jgi:hypothetical protein
MDMQDLRAAAVAKLAGRSPREVGRLKDLAALRWVYRWGWSSAQVIDGHASPGRRGVAARLVDKGLLESHETEGAGGIKGVPVQVLTLTQDGVAEVEAVCQEEELLPYPMDGSDLVIWRQLRHDLLIQRYTSIKLNLGKILRFKTPREINTSKSQKSIKQPDAVWVIETNGIQRLIAVELELTAKKDRELDQFALSVLNSTFPGSDSKSKGPFDFCVILSHSPAIITRYKSIFKPGATITLYKRNEARHWVTDGGWETPEYARNRIIFEKIDL